MAVEHSDTTGNHDGLPKHAEGSAIVLEAHPRIHEQVLTRLWTGPDARGSSWRQNRLLSVENDVFDSKKWQNARVLLGENDASLKSRFAAQSWWVSGVEEDFVIHTSRLYYSTNKYRYSRLNAPVSRLSFQPVGPQMNLFHRQTYKQKSPFLALCPCSINFPCGDLCLFLPRQVFRLSPPPIPPPRKVLHLKLKNKQTKKQTPHMLYSSFVKLPIVQRQRKLREFSNNKENGF